MALTDCGATAFTFARQLLGLLGRALSTHVSIPVPCSADNSQRALTGKILNPRVTHTVLETGASVPHRLAAAGHYIRVMHAMRAARRFLAAPSLRQASAPVSRAALHARAQVVARGCTRSPAPARALAVPALPLWNGASPFALVAGPAVRAAPARRPYATLSFFGGAPLARRALHALATTPRLAPPRPTTLVPARGESTMKRRKKMMNKHKVRKRRRAQRLKSSARRD